MNNQARGIDHVGLTVSNIEEADRFLSEGLGAQFIFELLSARDQPLQGLEVERVVCLPPGSRIDVIRMYKIGTGPGIELFKYTADEQRPPARGCDIGWQHVALYVDDIDAAVERAVKAGAERLMPPWSLMKGESGDGNRFCFVKAPFGALIEFITAPSPQAYESTAALRRWKPPTAG